jgi:hypothetical protein
VKTAECRPAPKPQNPLVPGEEDCYIRFLFVQQMAIDATAEENLTPGF